MVLRIGLGDRIEVEVKVDVKVKVEVEVEVEGWVNEQLQSIKPWQ